MPRKKSSMRAVVPSVLTDRGLKVRVRSSQGVLPGSRLVVKKKGEPEKDIAVKASVERRLSFTKQANGQWRTLHVVDLVLVVVPAEKNGKDTEVLAFESKSLISMFDKAWNALEKAGRSLSYEIPIFIPLDEGSRKNLGHDIANLKALAIWSVRLNPEEVSARNSVENDEFYDRIKRQIAEHNGVDISKVEFEYRIKP
jgi:hypothetical protein